MCLAVTALTDGLAGLVLLIAGGGLMVWLGAELLVAGASRLAARFGMSTFLIGATVVAFGTSLPELVTSVVAAYRGHLDMSVGNLLGSNLFNVLFVGGSLATVSTVAAPPELNYDLLWMLGVTVVVLPLATYRRAFDPTSAPRIDRLGGLLLIVAWIVYVTIRLA